MHYVKQFGLPRSGTNFTRWFLEKNFVNVRVLQNVFGSKHKTYCHKNFIQPADFWLKHQNVVTDLSAKQINNARRHYDVGKLPFIVTFKHPIHFLVSVSTYKNLKFDLSDNNACEKWVNKYNRFYNSFLHTSGAQVIIIRNDAFEENWEKLVSFFGAFGISPVHAPKFVHNDYFRANTDMSEVKTKKSWPYENKEFSVDMYPDLVWTLELCSDDVRQLIEKKIMRINCS